MMRLVHRDDLLERGDLLDTGREVVDL